MGNNTSKPKDRGKAPAFIRTDTSNSAKSSKSIRSRISLGKNDSDASSFRTANDGPTAPHTPIVSRKNSFAFEPINHSVTTGPTLSQNDTTTTGALPPSMQQMQPKEPILLRRNTDTDLPRPVTPGGAASLITGSSPKPMVPQISVSDSGFHSRKNSRSNSSGSLGRLDASFLKREQQLNALSTSEAVDELTVGATPLPPTSPGSIDIEDLIQRLLDAGYSGKRTKNLCLKLSEIATICAKAREIFLSQPPLLELTPPVKIVGDVHGQYSDLIRIFTKCGFPPAANYLFLGDYVDRGKQSLETILLLLCYKIKYPENFFLLRGNHECANVTRVYGFYDECKRRTNIKTWKIFIDTFNTLPIAATVAQKIFCVHGGLSPVLNSMDEIRNIARPTDVPDFGLLNDLLWSDPADTTNEWEDNERGVSYVFSKVAINKFLSKFSFDLVCRAHMVVEDGYEFFNDRSLVTVFSAPNYCGEFDNWGAVMSVSDGLLCSFELLDPLDSVALKQEMKKGKHERRAASFSAGNP